MVINMRKIELIKTRLYFVLAFLLLTAVCIVVYTSMRNEDYVENQPSDLAQEETQVTEGASENLQQVSSAPRQKIYGQSPSGEPKEDVTAQSKSDETTYRLAVTDGFLQVYNSQTGKLYMETAIVFDLLPARVQEQIKEGKYFESEEALLEFLENYSS